MYEKNEKKNEKNWLQIIGTLTSVHLVYKKWDSNKKHQGIHISSDGLTVEHNGSNRCWHTAIGNMF